MARKNKSSKKEFVWAIFILVILALFIRFYPQDKKACFKERCFKVEIEDNDHDRSIGLMYREKLASDRGMLFIFDYEDRYSFWMRNTSIPLDMIWFDKDKKVVYIKEGAQPCGEGLCETIKPDKKALYVLEINADKVKVIGLKVGDSIQF